MTDIAELTLRFVSVSFLHSVTVLFPGKSI